MSKEVRISFSVRVDDSVPAGLLDAAGYAAVVAAENTIENATDKAAVGSEVRVTIVANRFRRRGGA